MLSPCSKKWVSLKFSVISWGSGLGFRFAHPVAGAFDDDGFAVVEQSVEDGGGQYAVVFEDAGPVLEGFVGGEQQGAPLVACADDLEEQVGSGFVDGQVSDFTEDEQVWQCVFAKRLFKPSLLLRGDQVVDRFDGGDLRSVKKELWKFRLSFLSSFY